MAEIKVIKLGRLKRNLDWLTNVYKDGTVFNENTQISFYSRSEDNNAETSLNEYNHLIMTAYEEDNRIEFVFYKAPENDSCGIDGFVETNKNL